MSKIHVASLLRRGKYEKAMSVALGIKMSVREFNSLCKQFLVK